MPTIEEARAFCKDHINSSRQWEDVAFVGEIDREQAKSLWDLSRLEDDDWPAFNPEDHMKLDKNDRPFAYVCSPFSGDIETNMERAREYSRQVFEAGFTPITPHLYFPQFLRDDIPAEREAGMKMGELLLTQCRVLVVCGDRISDGMKREIQAAGRLNIPILTLDIFLPENAKNRPPAPSLDFYAELNDVRRSDKGKPSVLHQIAAARKRAESADNPKRDKPPKHHGEEH